MKVRAYLLHALSPLHAGTGQAVDVIDLPIARAQATGIPLVPGSSIKGVLRDTRKETEGDEALKAIFGPDRAGASENAGALMVGDARLLALPVRSFFGTFAWVTSPLLLQLAARDLKAAGETCPAIPASKAGRWAKVLKGSSIRHSDGKVYLEDVDLPAENDATLEGWTALLAQEVGLELEKRFAVVDDETMTFLWETATQIDIRVSIDADTRTAKDGALWTEESLPPETLLIGLMSADKSRRKDLSLSADDVLAKALPQKEVLQFGGKATVGRGRCYLSWLGGAR